MGQQEMAKPETTFDTTRRYVRVCEQRPDGFIEFEFAIGDLCRAAVAGTRFSRVLHGQRSNHA